MKPGNDVIYVYDGTLDGFLTCVFEAFERRENPVSITDTEDVQLYLGAEVRHIAADAEKSERVYKGITDKLGGEVLKNVYYATLSHEPDAEIAALSFLRHAFKIGRRAIDDLTDSRVVRFTKIARIVWQESGRFLEFIRFSELAGNILFAEFEPEPDVLPLIMPHFADRLKIQPFIIHDIGRKRAGVYDTKEWYIVDSGDMDLPDYSDAEDEYRELWKVFYDTIAVKERISERRRMQHLPKKYWKHLTEMQP